MANADIQPDDAATITARVRALAQQYVPDAIRTLAEIMMDGDAPASARKAAADSILDRADGKATAKVDTTVTTNTVMTLHLEALEALSVGHKGTVIEHDPS